MNITLASSTTFRQTITRTALRKPAGVRYNSSSTDKKAQDALADAQKAAGKAWENVSQFLRPAGQKLGNLLGGYKEPLVYNFSVAREVVKRIYIGEALQPPSLSRFAEAYRQIWSNAIQAAYWRGLVQSGRVTQFGIYGLQAYGIFKIGEILGRRHIIGYPVPVQHN
ncbi:ATP synthase subunit g, mitochondrial [Leucoagaricus sp. SymC.cos]|nr:ATP synthase subunit g, mitochondrial [Leucoagaricus sp. SymC.cos]